MKKISIIGGGASGLLCAIFCARANLKVDLYEQNSKLGKKILVSGNGRCNITNKNLSASKYYGSQPDFVTHALESFGFEKFSKFCSSIGLILDTKEDGKTYPLSNEAKTVLNLLTQEATRLHVNFIYETKVIDIEKIYNSSDALVIATGSQAAEHLGGCDDGMKFAKIYGHKSIKTYPSLVQFEINSHIFKKMAGAKVIGEVTLFVEKNKKETTRGDILFTNYGLSGFSILDISHSASKALSLKKKVDVSLNLLPSFSHQELSSYLQDKSNKLAHLSILEILSALIPNKIAQGILTQLKIDSHSKKLGLKYTKNLANTILNWQFEINDTHGFRHAEVAGGGVDVQEIDSKTMESKKQNNLYFCGEVLDIVGQRGGYNFAFAWASGYLCAQNIIKTNI